MTHLDNLLYHIPDLKQRRALDIGAGKGKLLIDAAQNGFDMIGIEFNPSYIAEAYRRAGEVGVKIDVIEGEAEKLPFPNNYFEFINFSEVIEHVNNPITTLYEAYRVLKCGGMVYISVPSRFSLFDTHFHLLFVNWLPRSWSDRYIGLFKKHKNYTGEAGRQRLSEMHYYTYGKFIELVTKIGFGIVDMRETKINIKFKHPFIRNMAVSAYKVLRPWLFKTFHFKLTKKYEKNN